MVSLVKRRLAYPTAELFKKNNVEESTRISRIYISQQKKIVGFPDLPSNILCLE